MKNKNIVEYLLDCGVKTNLKGFQYLYEAIEMTIENGYKLPKITVVIYPTIAKNNGDTNIRVERAIRHSIRNLHQKFRNMPNGEFISLAAINIKFGRKN